MIAFLAMTVLIFGLGFYNSVHTLGWGNPNAPSPRSPKTYVFALIIEATMVSWGATLLLRYYFP